MYVFYIVLKTVVNSFFYTLLRLFVISLCPTLTLIWLLTWK